MSDRIMVYILSIFLIVSVALNAWQTVKYKEINTLYDNCVKIIEDNSLGDI